MLRFSLSSTVICREPSSVELSLSVEEAGSLGGAEETAKNAAVPAIAMMMPATIARRVPLFTMFYDI